jgi:hypothetical protein
LTCAFKWGSYILLLSYGLATTQEAEQKLTVPCWTIFCASRSAWMLCELAGRGCGQWDLRQAASGFLRSFGRTVQASAEERNIADAWKAHHIGKAGVDGEMIAIADWRCEVGMMQRGLSTWRWQARAPPSALNRLYCRIAEHTLPLPVFNHHVASLSNHAGNYMRIGDWHCCSCASWTEARPSCERITPCYNHASSNAYLGDACRCHSRLRTAAGEARTTSRLRDAESAAGGIPEIPDSVRWRWT